MEPSRTSITATVGPACASAAELTAMAHAGADVFRVNGAHAGPESYATWNRKIRAAGRAARRNVALMVDLPGIKLRTGTMHGGHPVTLAAGARLTLTAGKRGGTATRVFVDPWPDITGVRKGALVLLDDGRLRLRVVRRRGAEIEAVVEDGGVLASGKGVAFPGVPLALEVPTARDRRLARAAIEAGADWLSLSFVGCADDVRRLRRLTKRAGRPDIPIVSKIERADAIPHLASILAASDAVIVARGDLGVDVGGENVPALQKIIVEHAQRAGVPAIIATEMLDSMTRRARPTRAEVSDVAGAVFEGADGVLLSSETAVGVHPAHAVATLDRILASAEADAHAPYAGASGRAVLDSLPGRPDQHVVHAAVLLAEETGAEAIVVFTRGGASAIRLSKERPRARIHAFSPDAAVCRQLALAWGVCAENLPAGRGTDAVVERARRRLCEHTELVPGDRAVLVMGSAQDPEGATTLIKLLTI